MKELIERIEFLISATPNKGIHNRALNAAYDHVIKMIKDEQENPSEPCIFLQKVKTLDCIKEGDKLVFESESGTVETVTAETVKHSKSDGTEIIYDLKNNSYFNLGMYLKGESWIARVYVIKTK